MSDVRFILTGGSAKRIGAMAPLVAQALGVKLPEEWLYRQQMMDTFFDVAGTPDTYVPTGGWRAMGKTERHLTLKVGPVLLSSHGMGHGSVSIWTNEVLLLAGIANLQDLQVIRVGTCGGVGVEAGTVVVGTRGFTEGLEPEHSISVNGDYNRSFSTEFDPGIGAGLMQSARYLDVHAVEGGIIGASGFHLAQLRRDGVIALDRDEAWQREQFAKWEAAGVRAVEMEAPVFAGLLNAAGVKGGDICAAVDRMYTGADEDGWVDVLSAEGMAEASRKAIDVAVEYVAGQLHEIRMLPYGRHTQVLDWGKA